MASNVTNHTFLTGPTLMALLIERAGGELVIPEDAAIAIIDRNADVFVSCDENGDLRFRLADKPTK